MRLQNIAERLSVPINKSEDILPDVLFLSLSAPTRSYYHAIPDKDHLFSPIKNSARVPGPE